MKNPTVERPVVLVRDDRAKALNGIGHCDKRLTGLPTGFEPALSRLAVY
jgi:hypothetical protein